MLCLFPPAHAAGTIRGAVHSISMHVSPTGIQDHWPKYLAEGILLIILGVAAMVVPVLSNAGIAVILGTVILMSGLGGLAATFHTEGAPGTVLSLCSSILGILVGTLLLLHPVDGITSLTLILVAFLVTEGALSTRFAIEHRQQLSGRWYWMLASGALDWSLGVALLVSLRTIAQWALNSAIALDLIVGGWALVGMALAGREAAALARKPGPGISRRTAA